MISAVEAVPTAISNSEVLSISVEKERDRPATLRHRAHEPRALSSIVTRTEAKTDALVDVLPFPPGAPHFHLGPRSSRDRSYIALNTRGSSEKRSKKAKIKVAENG